MIDHWLNEAVQNNAIWCDAIAASHGITTEWDESSWHSAQPMPPLYPNIVTLNPNTSIDKKIDRLKSHLPIGWGVKDSFGELELDDQGFRLAFEAHWYCCRPNQMLVVKKTQTDTLQSVKAGLILDRWVNAWGEGQDIFNTALLRHDTIDMVYIERDQQLVAGLITNLSGESVGISNTFGNPSDVLKCIALVAEKHSTRGIVGYGSKAEAQALSKFGFVEVGDLRVWLSRR